MKERFGSLVEAVLLALLSSACFEGDTSGGMFDIELEVLCRIGCSTSKLLNSLLERLRVDCVKTDQSANFSLHMARNNCRLRHIRSTKHVVSTRASL